MESYFTIKRSSLTLLARALDGAASTQPQQSTAQGPPLEVLTHAKLPIATLMQTLLPLAHLRAPLQQHRAQERLEIQLQ